MRNPPPVLRRRVLPRPVSAHQSPPHVSVIVPVYEPGPTFDDLIASLDRQTIPPGAFEVLLCDDGSGETTRARLAEVARTRPHVRVLTLPHTGWPGTPRNHGIDAARGRYVFFADQDDRLYPDALRALAAYADAHTSDVVIGRVVGIGRDIPRSVFRRDIPRAELGRDPLLALLTPHKLFRTAFLRDGGIRYPNGRVRLEDHLFVMEAYFRARTISILASTPCYAWLKNAGSASSSRIDPETYFPHLEAVLDLVERNTEPGALRDTLLRHWYRGKILGRLGGKRMRRYPAAYRERFLDAVIPLAQRRFGSSVEDGLPLPLRVRSSVLRAGRREDLLRLADYDAGLRADARIVAAEWTRGKIALTIRARVLDTDGEDLTPDGIGRALGLVIPPGTAAPADRVELRLEASPDAFERRIPGASAPGLRDARVVIDPVRVFARQDPSVGGRLRAHVRRLGWTFDVPLHADPGILRALGPSPVWAGRRCALVEGRDGVELRRQWPAGSARDLIARGARRARGMLSASRRALSAAPRASTSPGS